MGSETSRMRRRASAGQRVPVGHAALEDLHLLGVVGDPLGGRADQRQVGVDPPDDLGGEAGHDALHVLQCVPP